MADSRSGILVAASGACSRHRSSARRAGGLAERSNCAQQAAAPAVWWPSVKRQRASRACRARAAPAMPTPAWSWWQSQGQARMQRPRPRVIVGRPADQSTATRRRSTSSAKCSASSRSSCRLASERSPFGSDKSRTAFACQRRGNISRCAARLSSYRGRGRTVRTSRIDERTICHAMNAHRDIELAGSVAGTIRQTTSTAP